MHRKTKGSCKQLHCELQSPKASLVPVLFPWHVCCDWLQNILSKVEGNSHCSPKNNCTTLSPQNSKLQFELQPSPLIKLPSSHCSPSKGWVILSPHNSFWHCALQPSPFCKLPSSHSSPGSTT